MIELDESWYHISLKGRIVAVMDVYDALTSRRSNKDACSEKDAYDKIIKGSGINALYLAMGGLNAVLSRFGGDNFVLLFDEDKLPAVREVLSGMPVSYSAEQIIAVSSVAGIYIISDARDIVNPGNVMKRIVAA